MTQRFLTSFVAILVLSLTLLAGAATAQTGGSPSPAPPARSPFAAGGGNAERGLMAGRPAAPVAQPSSPVDRAWLWVLGKQAEINRALSQAVLRLKTESIVLSTLFLAGLSFAYGVLHAAGPGHGKAIISSYVLANEQTVRRGIYLSFLAALVQALMAIALVGVLAVALKATGLQMKRAEAWLETLSWGLVAAVGAWLLYRKLAQLIAERAAARASHHVHSHHGHDHPAHAHHDRAYGGHDRHDHACNHPSHTHAAPSHGGHAAAAHVHHAGCGHSHHDHAHGDACCDHAHMPDPRQLEGHLSWGKALAIVLAVGIRPCTGAIVVLVFALSQGLFWAGVFATFAMAIGTAITVSALAALAVGSRELAERLGSGSSRWAGIVGTVAGIGGSAAVMLLGGAFFLASLNGSGPL